MQETRNRAAVAFGSNLGDRVANIEAALAKLRGRNVTVTQTSHLYETTPMYYDDQRPFLNGVCRVETALGPLELLDVLQSVEDALGRVRVIDKGPRTIDLDIILFNQEHMDHPRLHVPHKLMLEREFVLRPLADILPGEYLPSTFAPRRTISELLSGLPDPDASMSPVAVLNSQLPLIRTRDAGRRTQVMAILNLTPDSFSDGGLHDATDLDMIRRAIDRCVSAGATLIDIGGQSTRPSADYLDPEEELKRVLPAIRAIKEMPAVTNVAISVDTFHADVARQSILAGADIINDVSGGVMDAHMLPTIAELGKTVVLMHMRGDPHTMTQLTDYPEGVVHGVATELDARVQAALAAGIPPWRIILDPGLGFAKTQQQNIELIRHLERLRQRESLTPFPWLLGPSRKGFVGSITGVEEAARRTYGTAAAVTASIAGGAELVRVHDVAEMVQVAKMADAIYRRPNLVLTP